MSNVTHSATGVAWGYDFDVQTRFFFYPAGSPNTIATCFALRALLAAPPSERPAGVLSDGATYLVDRLFVDDGDRAYFRYLESSSTLIHNANVMSASVLADIAMIESDTGLSELAARAIETTVRAQLADGSWPYAELSRQRWVDNFHTAYVLEALARARHLSPDVDRAIERGVAYWARALFTEDGTPKYWPNTVWPLDAQCFAQAVDTWLAVAEVVPGAVAAAQRTADLFAQRMVWPSGLVVFQKRRLWSNATPLTRWTAAPAFRALAHLHSTANTAHGS